MYKSSSALHKAIVMYNDIPFSYIWRKAMTDANVSASLHINDQYVNIINV